MPLLRILLASLFALVLIVLAALSFINLAVIYSFTYIQSLIGTAAAQLSSLQLKLRKPKTNRLAA